MIYPIAKTAPPHSVDLPESCVKDYEEARDIAHASPRGAAALLRLCIEKLCKEIGGEGQTLNENIASLVKEGLPDRVTKALDIVRVTGNEAVHPGTMTGDDHTDQVNSLFDLVNIIVEQMISKPKHLDDLFKKLPANARNAITKRDGNK